MVVTLPEHIGPLPFLRSGPGEQEAETRQGLPQMGCPWVYLALEQFQAFWELVTLWPGPNRLVGAGGVRCCGPQGSLASPALGHFDFTNGTP